MSDDLIRFVRARLDEDEQIARAASDGPWSAWAGPVRLWMTKGNLLHTVMTRERPVGEAPIMTESWMDSRHIMEWNPTRVLHEVEAKRQIVGEWEDAKATVEADPTDMSARVARLAFEIALRALAAVYADHPDYRQEWKA